MKKLLILSLILLTSCGHNIITDYKVKGLDISIPLGGYPFGIKIGIIEVNSNLLRGNATYSANNTSGVEAGSGAIQQSSVIQFSSNAQINEGNIEKIMTNEKISDDVKSKFISDYLSTSEAPHISQVTSKTSTATTVVGDDTKIHKQAGKVSLPKELLDSTTLKNILSLLRLLFNVQ